MNEMKIEKVDPRPDIGRCCICQSELATRVLGVDRTCEIRFCETCFDKFRDMLVGQANPAKLLETAEDLGRWAEQLVVAPKDPGSKECGEFLRTWCREALASKRRNCDEFGGDVADAAMNVYGRFVKFCAGRQCEDCKVREAWPDKPRHIPCFPIWSLMERNGDEAK